jgi:hypothetical protein
MRSLSGARSGRKPRGPRARCGGTRLRSPAPAAPGRASPRAPPGSMAVRISAVAGAFPALAAPILRWMPRSTALTPSWLVLPPGWSAAHGPRAFGDGRWRQRGTRWWGPCGGTQRGPKGRRRRCHGRAAAWRCGQHTRRRSRASRSRSGAGGRGPFCGRVRHGCVDLGHDECTGCGRFDQSQVAQSGNSGAGGPRLRHRLIMQ